MEKFFDIAGTTVRVTGTGAEMFCECGVLAPFEICAAPWDREMRCRVVETLAAPAGVRVFHDPGRQVFANGDCRISYMGPVERSLEGAYIRSARRGKCTEVEVRRSALLDRITPKTVLTAMEAEHLIAENGGVLFHAAYVAHEGAAILFTAPSGTGKSTQAELWCRLRGAELINGDRAVIRCTGHGVEARGVPFSGSSGISRNRTLPLKAIVYLSQAEQTRITAMTGVRAFRRIWEGCSLHTWDRQDVSNCMETVMKAVGSVPVFHLPCTPDESAVIALENALKEQGKL